MERVTANIVSYPGLPFMCTTYPNHLHKGMANVAVYDSADY